MKKILAAILALGLLFTGCGSDDSTPPKKHIEAKQLEQLVGLTRGAMFMGTGQGASCHGTWTPWVRT